jgi:uncharacterized protein YraI
MKRILTIGIVLFITLTACLTSTIGTQSNTPDAVATALAATEAVKDGVATSVAQTMAANPSQNTLPVPTNTAGVAPTATSIPTSTLPPSVVATAGINLNCRSGPSSNFDLIIVLNQGASGKVIGKNSVNTPKWYQLELEDGKQCWVAGDSLTITGDVSGVPEKASPPTPTPVPPASLWAGTWTTWENVCFSNQTDCEQQITVTFTMTGPNTLTTEYRGFGCTSIATYLTVSADGTAADGTQAYEGGECGNTVEVHLRLDPNKNQFRGRANIIGYSSLDAYWCGARNGYGKPNPTR